MSQPYGRPYSPSYSKPAPPHNPDTRPLPPGWVAQYDNNYNAWFYVNTNEEPPRSSWVHPLGPPPPSSPRPSSYAPPQGPPPPDRGRGYSPAPYSGGPPPPDRDPYRPGYGQPGRPPTPPRPAAYEDRYGSPAYNAPPPGGYRPNSGYGGPPPDDSRGFFGGSSAPPPVQQAPVEVIQQAPPKKHHMGMGTALAAGGAGILGGMLIGDLIEHHDEREQMEGFDAGFQDGRIDQGFMDGPFGGPPDNFGGPDFW
ncbi:hypothetical protein WOLCODRAFT_143636 [Wolfiporia cocos MD-104 SS10]|uniref:WW domain-containing protein n=1 Tax=Wolfiporia cocos (strain MD-104) TaxID=742152 RepID=A0A2H3JJ33_WOLCO|nr:hypothetical protein WOLCODRAFT_143636 [Wolfiporia cocos MD-104 SS10]